MAQSFILCLILAEAFFALAIAASQNTQPILHFEPASSPSISYDLYKAAEPSTRKLGKHQSAANFRPSEVPQVPYREENHVKNLLGQVQEIHLKKDHHSIDKSVAGGVVILGGLATTFLVAVFCYIRATGRHKADNLSQTTIQNCQ